MVMYTCNSGTWEMEHEGQEFKANLLYSELGASLCYMRL